MNNRADTLKKKKRMSILITHNSLLVTGGFYGQAVIKKIEKRDPLPGTGQDRHPGGARP
jgi:hypothetical protein